MTREDILPLLEEAALAPSVHNVQPARWRIEEDGVSLFEDPRRRLTVADQKGSDAAISLGAAVEGLALAAGRRRLVLKGDEPPVSPSPELVPVARFHLAAGGGLDPLAEQVDARRSWRGDFARTTPLDRAATASLVSDDAAVLAEPARLTEIARLFAHASYGFMRDAAFRAELVSWMRLSPRHPRWNFDGLNAEAMALGRIEAFAAGMVLGAGFVPLDRLGLAPTLLDEGGKVARSAAVVVFHRPAEESRIDSGRAFYRLWLRLEAAGFGAAVLAALADNPEAAATLSALCGLEPGRRVISAFRIGRRPKGKAAPRSRRPLQELLV